MDYRQALDYLFGLQRFGVKLGLDNIRALMERLGRPDRSYGIVHVAGSNGKGSTAAALAEILLRAGHRVGLYTSPHLHSFTERIRVDGLAIEESEVARLADDIRGRCEDVPATFFEFATAMALEYFHRRNVEIAVLEVGLGGRLDATNVVDPWLCLITSITCDHAEHLGRDLSAVAREKAGILKPAVPVLSAAQEPAAMTILEARAADLKAPLSCFGRDISARPGSGGFDYRGLDRSLPALRPGLAGKHQWENLSLALGAAELLARRGISITEKAMRRGIAEVRWPGRLEWWPGRILLDGAHNRGGAEALAAYLESLKPGRVHWVVGTKKEKDVNEILAPLAPWVHAMYCTEPPVESPCPAGRLAEEGVRLGLPAVVCQNPLEAFGSAMKKRTGSDLVLVAGSLFLVGAVRDRLIREKGVKDPLEESPGRKDFGMTRPVSRR